METALSSKKMEDEKCLSIGKRAPGKCPVFPECHGGGNAAGRIRISVLRGKEREERKMQREGMLGEVKRRG